MNPQKLMKQLQQKQERVQQEIAALEIEASSGGGMVTVVMDGHKAVKSLSIDPEVVSKDDVDMLQDLVLAAVNEAGRFDRLRHQVLEPGPLRVAAVVVGRMRGDGHAGNRVRRRLELAHPPHRLEAIHPGHVDVADQEVVARLAE